MVCLLDLPLRSRLRQTKRVVQRTRHRARSVRARSLGEQGVGSDVDCPRSCRLAAAARAQGPQEWRSRARAPPIQAQAEGRALRVLHSHAPYGPCRRSGRGAVRPLRLDAVHRSTFSAVCHCSGFPSAPAPRRRAPRWPELRTKSAMCASRHELLRRRQSISTALVWQCWRGAGAFEAPPRGYCRSRQWNDKVCCGVFVWSTFPDASAVVSPHLARWSRLQCWRRARALRIT